MSLRYIRDQYGVPAKRGGRIEYTFPKEPRFGRIVSANGALIRVQFDGESRPVSMHPTWEIKYLDQAND